MLTAYINRIATAVPPFDIHQPFVDFAATLFQNESHATFFRRLVKKAGIEHRYSFLEPSAPEGSVLDKEAFYVRGKFPSTAGRMRYFETHAPELAAQAIEGLHLGDERDRITHLIVTSCTGFSAPGLDIELIARSKLPATAERTIIGFMGCYAAINAYKLAHHIVRSEPNARVLTVNLELCTLHLQETRELEKILSFLLWGDGCAATLISAEPEGLAIEGFHSLLVPGSAELIKWNIGDSGFDMFLSGQVPATIQTALKNYGSEILVGTLVDAIGSWAIHPGGRTVLDAVERAFSLGPQALDASRKVLELFGNMSSSTVVFVLKTLLNPSAVKASGVAMSFGPGLVAETMRFRSTRYH